MRSLLKITTGAIGVLAIGVGALSAASDYLWPEGPIEFRPEVHRIDAPFQPGEERELCVTIHNGTRSTVRLIGGANLCGPMGCATVKGLPLTLPPGSDRRLYVLYKAAGAGALSYDGPIFTDWPLQPTIALKLSGSIVETARP